MAVAEARTLKGRVGRPFAKPGSGREAVDGESLRFDPRTRRIVWASEGDAVGGFGPAIRWMERSGKETGRLTLPPIFQRARPNRSIEGLALAPDGAVWAAVEAPFQDDGEMADASHGALVRLTRLGAAGALGRQYAYPVEPVKEAPPAPLRSDNGVSEILAVDDHRFLVLERSGHETTPGHFAFHNRLYLADLSQATDVASVHRLTDGGFTPARKTLVLDFDSLPGAPIGCVEAMAWMPGENGKRLVLVTDNNFDAAQPTELLVLKLDL